MTDIPAFPGTSSALAQPDRRPTEVYSRFFDQLVRALRERDETIADLTARSEMVVKAGAPSVSDVPDGQFRVIKNTTGPAYALVVNDGGVLKSVALT